MQKTDQLSKRHRMSPGGSADFRDDGVNDIMAQLNSLLDAVGALHAKTTGFYGHRQTLLRLWSPAPRAGRSDIGKWHTV